LSRAPERAVFLAGFMGTGKTEVGRALARRLKLPFYDSDAEVERRARMSVAEIFARKGEPYFRRRERAVVAELAVRGACVVSLGGGALLDSRTAVLARPRVALTCSEPELWRRLKPQLPRRPLLKGGRAALRALLRRRRTLYRGALVTVSTTRRSPAAAAALIARRIRYTRPHGA
jgi:shikimate kinase